MERHEVFYGVDEIAFREFLKEVSGRTFWKASFFLNMGFSQEFVDSLTRDYVTDPADPKSRIFDTSQGSKNPTEFLEAMIDPESQRFTKEHVVAVHERDLLRTLIHKLEIRCDVFFGRGSQASEYAKRLHDYLDGKPQTPLRVTDPDRKTAVIKALIKEEYPERHYSHFQQHSSSKNGVITVSYNETPKTNLDDVLTYDIHRKSFNAKAAEMGFEIALTRSGRICQLRIEGPENTTFIRGQVQDYCDVCVYLEHEPQDQVAADKTVELRMRTCGDGDEVDRMWRIVLCQECFQKVVFHESYGVNMIISEFCSNGIASMTAMILEDVN